jgi:2-polyprenyl-6-methoxyphenol hydroxylase-like FAD-dependent oxidoreductase
MVARAAAAREYHQRPALSGGVYAYWSGLPVSGGEIYARDGRAIGAWPTNDGLVITYVAVPAGEFAAFRADLEGNFLATLDLAGDLGERARGAARAERFRATPDLPNAFRVPHGPGWALAGDAGLVMDPLTGQGIGMALRDADELAGAVVAGLGGAGPLDRALAGYRKARDARALPMYKLTTGLASLRPNPAGGILFPALAGDQSRTEEFLGVLTGTVDPGRFFSPRNLARILGVRGMLAAARARAA